ncbi:hypothetical protein TNCV_4495961 [Trichonephila clavipes]|nr:hypothetical protein TNCV_4495961 [Trichonephila clavipes]
MIRKGRIDRDEESRQLTLVHILIPLKPRRLERLKHIKYVQAKFSHWCDTNEEEERPAPVCRPQQFTRVQNYEAVSYPMIG